MSVDVRCTTPCHRDVVAIATRIGNDDPNAAERFLNAFDAACRTLTRVTDWGSRFESDDPRHENIRLVAIPTFHNYVMFYRKRGDTMEILRVIHGARDLPTAFDDAN